MLAVAGGRRHAVIVRPRSAIIRQVSFPGFAPAVFEWFSGLERDNSKAYFTATRPFYEDAVRGGMEGLLDELAVTFGGDARVFRQQRDIRFTPDKSPYKTRTYGVLQGAPSSFYAELSARGLYAGSGYYRLARDQLDRFRSAIDDERTGPALAEAAAAVEGAGLELAGASLQTAPRGFPREHPRIELLRRKALFAGLRTAPGRAGIDRDAALEHVAGAWTAAEPLNAWLHAHVGPTVLEDAGRRR
jgi:uncharacterized protein (TIGR02453 family)